MLFDQNAESKDLFVKLKEKILEVSQVVKTLREENASLRKEADGLREEIEKQKSRVEFYEGERRQLQGAVDELLKDFEKVSQ